MADRAEKTLLINVDAKAKDAIRELNKLENKVKKTSKTLKKIGIAAGIVGFAIFKGLKSATQAAIRQENAIKQLEAVLKSTGGQAGVTSKELINMAASLQKVTTFGDEAIIEAQSMLLTFTNLGKEVFPQATEAVLNVSKAMGQDLRTSVIQLGKVLNAPTANMGALSRAGIQFTDAQKEMITTLEKSGDLLSAQKIILAELETQFGGSARAAAETFGGKMEQLKNTFGDFKEAIGKGVTENKAFSTALDDIKKLFEDPKFQESIATFVSALVTGLVKIAKIAADVVKALAKIIKTIEKIDPTAAVGGIAGAFEGLDEEFNKGQANLEKYMKRFRAFRNHAKLSTKQIREMRDAYGDYGEILQAIARGDYGTKLQQQWRKFNTEQLRSIDLQKESTGTLNKQAEAMGKVGKSLKSLIDSMPKSKGVLDFVVMGEGVDPEKLTAPWIDSLSKIGDKVLENKEEVKKAAEEWDKINAKLRLVDTTIGALTSVFDKLGISLGGVVESAGSVAKGLINIASPDIFSKITGVAQLLGGIVDIGKSILGLFTGDGVGEAIERSLGKAIKISDELEKKIRDLEEQTGNTREAIAILADEIIRTGNVTKENFKDYAQVARDVLAQLDTGAFTASEASTELGQAFNALIEKANKLGIAGSRSILDIIGDVKNRGLEVAEINEYIAAQMQTGLEGYKNFLAGEFSDVTVDVFETMLKLQEKIADNKALVDGIKGLGQALLGLSSTQELTQTQFDKFGKAATDGFDKLRSQGFTAGESLDLLKDTLGQLAFLQNEFGFQTDEATQRLIDMAKQQGVIDGMEDPMERTADSLEKLVEILSNAFPNAVTKAASAIDDQFGSARKSVERFGNSLAKVSKNSGVNIAFEHNKSFGDSFAGGFDGVLKRDMTFRAEAGERVRVDQATDIQSTQRANNVTIERIVMENNFPNVKRGGDMEQIVRGLRRNTGRLTQTIKEVIE